MWRAFAKLPSTQRVVGSPPGLIDVPLVNGRIERMGYIIRIAAMVIWIVQSTDHVCASGFIVISRRPFD